MASGRNSVRLIYVCSLVVFYLLLAVCSAAQEQPQQWGSEVAGPPQEYYLRGRLPSSAQLESVEQEFEEFVRRELADQYIDPSANCENDPSLCP
uniref:Uncharacterized protein n=1 Tax=Physcomitrium patens TaxID=3218 RepID=A0A2K1KZY3_PHYPA|nr:hypothetical protein PHYPA_002135 [Physcomitrium patens]